MKAYVLINVHPGNTRSVVENVRRVEGVVSAHACWGRPDIFAFVDAPELAETVMEKIGRLDGVESTDTHVLIE